MEVLVMVAVVGAAGYFGYKWYMKREAEKAAEEVARAEKKAAEKAARKAAKAAAE